MSTNFNDILVRWRTRVGYEFPERYQSYINRGDYLAAFLLACNLVEFYLIQYLFELSFDFELRKEVTLATRLQRLLRFLPPPLAERLIMLFIRLRRPAIERKPTDYVSEGWTLGRLIEEAKSYGADKDLIKRLYAFNGQRKLI